MRHIAAVISDLAPGGAQRVLLMLAKHWQSSGDRVQLITLGRTSGDFFDVPPGITRHDLSVSEAFGSLVRSAIKRGAVVRRLRRLLRGEKPDVVVSFIDETNVMATLAAAGTGIPVVISERIDPRHHQLPRVWRLLRRRVYPHADRLVIQTEAVRSWAEGLMAPDRVEVIPNPVTPCASGEMNRDRVVLAVGRLTPQKGFDLLLRAFAASQIAAQGWIVHVSGRGGEEASLRELARALGVESSVKFGGVTGDTAELMRSASIFILSSRYEGFPNVLTEAMSHGMAVASFDCPSGPAEIIRHDVDGLLVPPENIEMMAGALARLASDETLRQRLGGRAREVCSRFSIERINDRWQQVFDSITRQRAE